jgi:hypothetical protein
VPGKKFYVVPDGGQSGPTTLFQIAKRFLGDGYRYPEIFWLNFGSEQADGERLEDPMTIRPGWILILPPDALGEGVQTIPAAPFMPETSQPANAPASVPDAVPSGDGPDEPSMASAGGAELASLPGAFGAAAVTAALAALGWVVVFDRKRRVQPGTAVPRADAQPDGVDVPRVRTVVNG